MFLISWIVAPSIIMRRLFEARGPRHLDFGYAAHSTCQVQQRSPSTSRSLLNLVANTLPKEQPKQPRSQTGMRGETTGPIPTTPSANLLRLTSSIIAHRLNHRANVLSMLLNREFPSPLFTPSSPCSASPFEHSVSFPRIVPFFLLHRHHHLHLSQKNH